MIHDSDKQVKRFQDSMYCRSIVIVIKEIKTAADPIRNIDVVFEARMRTYDFLKLAFRNPYNR